MEYKNKKDDLIEFVDKIKKLTPEQRQALIIFMDACIKNY